jgi:DNA-binding MarR family transcriptional regulator
MGSQGIADPDPAAVPAPDRQAPARRDAGAVLTALRRLVRFLRLAQHRSQRADGLSAAQRFVLESLAVAPASSLAELAERTLTDGSSVSIVVLRLVERGLVVRRPARDDRRRAELLLSPRGRALAGRGQDLAQVRIIEAIARMPSARRQTLVTALEALVRDIGADTLAPHMLFEDEQPQPRRRSRATRTRNAPVKEEQERR